MLLMTDVVSSPYGELCRLWHSVLMTLRLRVPLLPSRLGLRQLPMTSTITTVPRLVCVPRLKLLIDFLTSFRCLCSLMRLHVRHLVVGGRLRAPIEVSENLC